MRPRDLRFIAQLGILAAIATCMALLVDALGVTPAYCSGATGCHTAKLAARQVLGAVPLPLIGLLAFVGLLGVTTLRSGRWVGRLELVAAGVAAVFGAGFLCIQAFALKAFCPFCVVVDALAIGICVALLAAWRLGNTDRSQWLHPVATGGLVAFACVVPLLWPHFRPASVTPFQLSGYVATDKVSIVEFVDLSCSHCRDLYSTLERLQKEQGERIHFVRLHAPLRSHRHAREGARLIACLGPDQTRLEQLTAVLFESPVLDHKAVIAGAEYVGMTPEEVDTCLADPMTDRAIDDNIALLESLGFQGLPTTYVAGERIVGAQPYSIYLAALDRVTRTGGTATAETTAFALLFGLLFLGIVEVGRRRANVERQTVVGPKQALTEDSGIAS